MAEPLVFAAGSRGRVAAATFLIKPVPDNRYLSMSKSVNPRLALRRVRARKHQYLENDAKRLSNAGRDHALPRHNPIFVAVTYSRHAIGRGVAVDCNARCRAELRAARTLPERWPS